ncbi:MAG: hypothetical protein Q8J97_12675, partial [Flavobacteriaceae bacterium]|nr:hypothetical protein [Flavobacteriaceae bacterium]
MKKSLLATVFIALFFATGGYAQFVTNSGLNQMSSRTQVLQQKLNNPIENDSIGVVGSPYEFKSFLPANVYYKDTLMGSYLVRYNVFGDEMQVRKNSTKEIEALLKTKEIHVKMNDLNYFYYNYVLNEVFQQGYFLEIVKGEKANFLVRKKKIYVPGRKSKNSYVPASPNRFSDTEDYFILFQGKNQPIEIPSSNKKFLALFDDGNNEKYQNFIKENKLKLNKSRDLEKFFI